MYEMPQSEMVAVCVAAKFLHCSGLYCFFFRLYEEKRGEGRVKTSMTQAESSLDLTMSHE